MSGWIKARFDVILRPVILWGTILHWQQFRSWPHDSVAPCSKSGSTWCVGHEGRSYVFLKKVFNFQHLNFFHRRRGDPAAGCLLKSSSSCINISSKVTPFSLAEGCGRLGFLYLKKHLEILLKVRQVRDLMLLGSFESLRHNLLQWKRDKAARLLAVHSTAWSWVLHHALFHALSCKGVLTKHQE